MTEAGSSANESLSDVGTDGGVLRHAVDNANCALRVSRFALVIEAGHHWLSAVAR